MRECGYDESWGRVCKEPVAQGFCPRHEARKCARCQGQATHDCEVTVGPLVCGSPLCESCECPQNHNFPFGPFRSNLFS